MKQFTKRARSKQPNKQQPSLSAPHTPPRNRVVATAIALVTAVALAGLYLFQISSLMPAGGGELYAVQSADSLSDLLRNPLLLPFKLMVFVLIQLPFSDLLAVRLASVAVALLSSLLFFMLARRWYGNISGSVVAGLFATAGWLLHTGRYGAAVSMLTLTVLMLLNLFVWISHTERSNQATTALAAVAALSLFTPGGMWLVLAGGIVCRQAIAEHLKAASVRTLAVSSLILTTGATLIIFAIVRDLGIVRQWIGLPDDTPSVIMLAKQAGSSVSAFIIRGPLIPEVWLAHTPILDVASTILLLTGTIFYSRHMRNARTLLLLAFFAVGAMLVMFNGPVALGFLAPIFYLVVGGGLAYFLHQWRKVFPKNPIAKIIGFTAIGVITLSIVSFHVQRYFVAWRYSPDTVQAYQDAKQGANPTPYLLQ